jgi:hypothetical protein
LNSSLNLRRARAASFSLVHMRHLTRLSEGVHKSEAKPDRYHIVSGADQVETVRKLAAPNGMNEPESPRVVAIGEALAEERGTVRAQSERSQRRRREQFAAPLWRALASPTIENSNRILSRTREVDALRRALGAVARVSVVGRSRARAT